MCLKLPMFTLMVGIREYITLLHLFLSDSGWNPHSNWNFWNSGVFHLHIFFLIICNSNRTGVEIYSWNPWNPHRLASAFSSQINWNLHSRLLLPCKCYCHCTVTCDCQLTTTIHNDTTCLPNPSHYSLPPLTSINGNWHHSHTLPQPHIKNKQQHVWLQTCHVMCVFQVLTTVDLC